jgi:hypothetical protein
VQALGTEVSVRSFLTLCNGSTLAGTDNHAMIYKSLNCAADLDIIHNLGFMPSTAAEPSAYFLLAQPKFDPFPVHLKYQSSDYIRVNMMQVGDNGVAPTYDFTCAQVTEILDLKSVKTFNKQFQGKTTPMSFYLLIGQTEWLSNTAAGPLPGTIERVGSYTPLVTASFDDILSSNDNNLQAAMDTLDDHTHGSQIAGSTEKTVLVDADQFPLVDSETTTHVLKYTLWSNIKSKIFAVLGIQIDAATRMTSPLDTDLVTMVDENTSGKLVKGMTWANLKARFLTYLATQIITLSGLNVGSATGAGVGNINLSGSLVGRSYAVTSESGGVVNIDTGLTANGIYSAVYLITLSVDPWNRSSYKSVHQGTLLISVGWNGSQVQSYLQLVGVISNAQHSFWPVPVLTAVFANGATETSNVYFADTSYNIRIKLTGDVNFFHGYNLRFSMFRLV